jgi:hypothetical protein
MNIQTAVIAAAISSTIMTSSLTAQVTEPQSAPGTSGRWEVLVPGGAIVPTGTQRDAIKRGNLTAIQLTYVVRPSLAITSTVGWARSRDLTTVGNPKLDVFTYDVGAEVRAPRWFADNTFMVSAFAGAGAGGRSYDYRKLDVDAAHNLAAYGSVGGEVGFRRVRVRLEARDYVSAFKPLAVHGTARTGNDVVVMAGLRFVSR